MKIARNSLIVIGMAALVACQTTPPPNRGRSGYRLDPTHDAPSELGTRMLRSADLIAATNKMAQDIASRLDITNRASPPRIVVGPIENRTSRPHQNLQIFLARLRTELNSLGARTGLEFIADRARIERARAREYGSKDPASTAAAYRSRADYMLTCEVYDLPSGGTNYYLLDYQLVQLRDVASGPGLGPGGIVWENSYEVKFQ